MRFTAKNKTDVHFINQVKRIFKSKTVLTAVFVTLFLIIVFDFLSKIPMPGLDAKTFANSLNPNSNNQSYSFLSMLNLLGGGGLKNLSLFATGISPYITTQIIIQLLSSDVIPPLARLTRNGEKGRKKISMITKILTLPFTIVQAYSIIAIYQSQGVVGEAITPVYQFFYITVMCAGTYIAIFFSDIITKKGVGNGVTTIILAGIVSQLVGNFTLVRQQINASVNGELYQIIAFIFYILFYLLILWTITFISLSSRRIPIQQTGQSLIKEGDDLPYLPFKLNTAGVIPVIFASSLITLPLTIGEIIRSSTADNNNWFYVFTNTVFNFNNIGGIITYIILIILFTFFYSHIQLNPKKISTDFMKSGRFILGVKIGTTTEKYISRVLYRLNWIGGPFLAVITALPYIVSYASHGIIPSVAALGGTAIIIMVSGSIDLWDSIASASTTSSYTVRRKKIQESQPIIEIKQENAKAKDKDFLW